MNILLINPNTSRSITDRLAGAARQVASTDTCIECVTAERGVPYISTRTEAIIGGMQVIEILADRHRDFDAAIVAAFGDPGLGAARELFDLPVVGLAEAGMLTACMLGCRFSIVTFAQALGPWYRECVAWHGLEGRCASIRMLEESFASISYVQDEKEALLVDLANRAVDEDDADVVILAGAPLAGLAGRVADRVSVPVVDCAEAAVKQAETLVALRPRAPLSGSFRRPDPKAAIGVPASLAAYLAHATP